MTTPLLSHANDGSLSFGVTPEEARVLFVLRHSVALAMQLSFCRGIEDYGRCAGAVDGFAEMLSSSSNRTGVRVAPHLYPRADASI
jgi:hypothetical protein